jgi:hypothetical protein
MVVRATSGGLGNAVYEIMPCEPMLKVVFGHPDATRAACGAAFTQLGNTGNPSGGQCQRRNEADF